MTLKFSGYRIMPQFNLSQLDSANLSRCGKVIFLKFSTRNKALSLCQWKIMWKNLSSPSYKFFWTLTFWKISSRVPFHSFSFFQQTVRAKGATKSSDAKKLNQVDNPWFERRRSRWFFFVELIYLVSFVIFLFPETWDKLCILCAKYALEILYSSD